MSSPFGTLQRRILSFATRHPWPVLAATAALSVLFAFSATRLRIDTDLTSLLPNDAEVNRDIERYAGDRAGERVLVVAVEGGGLFDLGALAGFAKTIDAIAALPGVTGVITPFNLPTFQRSRDGRLQIVPLATGRTAPADMEDLAEFRARLAATRYARNLVASADGRLLAAFVQVERSADAGALMDGVRAAMSSASGPGVTPRVTGLPALDERTAHYLSRDAMRLLALAALVVLVFYWLGFRSKRAVFLSFAVVLLGTLWSVGLMGLAGIRLSLVSIVAPPLILIFGNEYAIYVMSEYYRLGGSAGPAAATVHGLVDGAVAGVARPILMAFLTTIVGFLSLCVTDIRQTREFAVVASFGSLACGLISLFTLPAALSLLARPREDRTRRLLEGPLSRLMDRTAGLVARRPFAVLAVVPAAVAVFAIGVRQLAFNTDSVTYYPQRDPVIQDMYALTEAIGGFDEIHLTLEAPAGAQGYFLEPTVLRQAAALEAVIREDPDVSWSISLPSLLSDVRLAVDGTADLPESRGVVLLFSRLVARAAGGAGAGVLAGLADEGLNRITLTFRIGNSDTGHFMDEQRFRSFLAGMRAAVASHPVGEARPVIWGDIMRNLSLADAMRGFLLTSMVISVAIIFLIAALSFRSAVRGIFAVVPLAAGLMLNFAFMAFAGIPLDMTTIMVANVAIGVGIDSAIYLVIEYARRRRCHPDDLAAAVAATLRVMGRPVILSTLSIAAGLAVLATAAFRPIVYFGLLVLFSLAVTAAGNLVLLPALLVVEERARAAVQRRRAAKARS